MTSIRVEEWAASSAGDARPAVVLVHGMQESTRAWDGWRPYLGGRRVLLVDLPGHGRAPAPARGYEWSVEHLARELGEALAGVGRVHLVAAKLAGAIAVELAATASPLVRSLTLVGAPLSTVRLEGSVDLRSNLDLQQRSGTAAFVAATQDRRLGSDASPELVAWLDRIMAGTDPATAIAVARMAADGVDVTGRLPGLRVPVLVIAATRSPLLPVARARSWVEAMPDARLNLIDSDAYHVAAACPRESAEAVAAFIAAHDTI